MEKTLNDVINTRLFNKLEAGKEKTNAFVQALITEVKNQRDFLIKANGNEGGVSFFNRDTLMMQKNGDAYEYRLHSNAITQIGEKLNIPTAYLNKLAMGDNQHRDLAVEIMRYHRDWTKDTNTYLIRTAFDQAKGFLSSAYKRMDTALVLTSFFESVNQNSASIADSFKSDTRYWVEALIPQIIYVPTEKNGEVGLAFGVRLGNSDYGDGALDLRSFMLQPICANGLVRESLMNKVHLGKRLEDNIAISNETYKKESEMIAGAVRDITKYALNIGTIRENIAQVQVAGATSVNLEREFLALVTKGMGKSEIEQVSTVLQQNDPNDGVSGEATLWKLTQAVTAVGRNIGGQRERELAQLAGELMDRTKK